MKNIFHRDAILEHGKHKLLLAASCLVCLVVMWSQLDDLGTSEFIGGWLTGVLSNMGDAGSFLC